MRSEPAGISLQFGTLVAFFIARGITCPLAELVSDATLASPAIPVRVWAVSPTVASNSLAEIRKPSPAPSMSRASFSRASTSFSKDFGQIGERL